MCPGAPPGVRGRRGRDRSARDADAAGLPRNRTLPCSASTEQSAATWPLDMSRASSESGWLPCRSEMVDALWTTIGICPVTVTKSTLRLSQRVIEFAGRRAARSARNDALMFVKGLGGAFRGCSSGGEVMCRTGCCWVADKTGMGRSRWSASSYEVTPSRLKVRPGTADESFEGQQVRGSRLSGQAVPGAFRALAGDRAEVRVDLAGDVTLQAADDLRLGFPFGGTALGVGAGARVRAQAGEHDPP